MTKALDPFDDSTWSDDQRWYFDHVDQALEAHENVIISNGKPEHAVFLIHRFLSNAKAVVRLFSGKLSQTYGNVQIYGNAHVSDAASKALGEGVDIRIVLEDSIDAEHEEAENHPLVRLAREMDAAGTLKGSLRIYKASAKAHEFLDDFRYHWMTMDDRAYRLETEPEKAKAHVNFGDSDMVSSLSDIFDNVLLSDGVELARVSA